MKDWVYQTLVFVMERTLNEASKRSHGMCTLLWKVSRLSSSVLEASQIEETRCSGGYTAKMRTEDGDCYVHRTDFCAKTKMRDDVDIYTIPMFMLLQQSLPCPSMCLCKICPKLLRFLTLPPTHAGIGSIASPIGRRETSDLNTPAT